MSVPVLTEKSFRQSLSRQRVGLGLARGALLNVQGAALRTGGPIGPAVLGEPALGSGVIGEETIELFDRQSLAIVSAWCFAGQLGFAGPGRAARGSGTRRDGEPQRPGGGGEAHPGIGVCGARSGARDGAGSWWRSPDHPGWRQRLRRQELRAGASGLERRTLTPEGCRCALPACSGSRSSAA